MTGPGYWLNPATRKWIEVTRHELAMCDAVAMGQLGVVLAVVDAARQISPYHRDSVDELRLLGIRSGLIRVRDHGLYISVQFQAQAEQERELLRFVYAFFEANNLWRPYVRLGNFQTRSEDTVSWQELIARVANLEAAGQLHHP